MRSHRFERAIRLLTISAPTLSACSAAIDPGGDIDALEEPIVYGVDDRKEYLEASAVHRGWADSVALVTASSGLACIGTACGVQLDMVSAVDGNGTSTTGDDEVVYGLCSGENFGPTPDQPGGQLVAAHGLCTAFLVGPDLMATAGHCLVGNGGTLSQAQTACGNLKIIFDFRADSAGVTPVIAQSSNIFGCQTILGVSNTATADYAVFRLDRAASGRSPLPLRRSGRVADGRGLALIGHPAAMPLKVSAGGHVRSNTASDSFQATIDAFGGNSGSPVLDRDNGLVQGIMTAGQPDWIIDDQQSCLHSNTCAETGCSGQSERVQRTAPVLSLVPSIAPRAFESAADTTSGVYSPVTGDFDGDGNADVFWYGVGAAPDRIRWSNGARASTLVSTTVSGTYTPVAGDFDGDRRADIIWYSATATTHPIWWGNSARTFTKLTVTMTGSYQPFTGDFDKDGRADVYWYGPGSAADHISYGSASRTFTTVSKGVGGTYRPVAGDFDGDGATDILWYATGTANDYFWWGSSARTFAVTNITITASYQPFAGDFDGDGGTDIFLYGPGTAADSVLWSRRDRRFLTRTITVNGTFTPLTGDFNGDASWDVYWYGSGAAADGAWWARLR